ncbi:rhomboid family intramembrane serine protease [Rhodobacteraceae bacterium NNCM2]|nr:rhomboid family intramembrane serine protease [Coraliihabitans acroporae]
MNDQRLAGAARQADDGMRHSTLICWLILAGLLLIELGISLEPGARMRIISDLSFRDEMTGFWPIQRPDWRWLSYVYLHGSSVHAATNVAVYVLFAPVLCQRIGGLRLLILFTLTGVAAALTFAATSDAQGMLVGASGAVYGLIGAGKFWEAMYLRREGGPWLRFWLSILFFIALNIVLVMVSGGAVAWTAHLGGAIAGAMLAPILKPNGPDGRMII